MPVPLLRPQARMVFALERTVASTGRRSFASVASAPTSTGSGGFTHNDLGNFLNKTQHARNDMAYSLSFGDKTSYSLSSMVEPSALMKEQIQFSVNQLKRSPSSKHVNKKMDNAALPKTLEDVQRQKSRAIVVTETDAPFHVVDVNECWEGLCGYTFSEARGKTLGSLLKGPKTDQVAATGLIAHLLAGEEAGAVLTNYTKNGREFQNRIRVGPLYDSAGDITHFVGVLEELNELQYA